MYKKVLTAVNLFSELSLNETNPKEIDRFAESEIYWTRNKNKKLHKRANIKKGDVCQFEFGKNFPPEMSYEHRGLVIGNSENILLYVLPIFSYNEDIPLHQEAYHPIDNPDNPKSNYYLLKPEEFSFIKHKSLLKLNDIRTVSVSRIKYKQTKGKIDINSDTYKNIEKLVLEKYFSNFAYQYKQLEEENKQLKIELQEKELVTK